jgi:hypothetical protein
MDQFSEFFHPGSLLDEVLVIQSSRNVIYIFVNLQESQLTPPEEETLSPRRPVLVARRSIFPALQNLHAGSNNTSQQSGVTNTPQQSGVTNTPQQSEGQ